MVLAATTKCMVPHWCTYKASSNPATDAVLASSAGMQHASYGLQARAGGEGDARCSVCAVSPRALGKHCSKISCPTPTPALGSKKNMLSISPSSRRIGNPDRALLHTSPPHIPASTSGTFIVPIRNKTLLWVTYTQVHGRRPLAANQLYSVMDSPSMRAGVPCLRTAGRACVARTFQPDYACQSRVSSVSFSQIMHARV